MIIVTAPSKDGVKEFSFHTTACEIIDGALVIHKKVGDSFLVKAGFAPGAWITFEVDPDAD